MKREGKAKIMRVFVGESDKWHEKPLYKAIVECLRANDIAGVTVYKGIRVWGEPSDAQGVGTQPFARLPDHAVGCRHRRKTAKDDAVAR